MGTVRSRQLSWIALLAAAILIVSGLLAPAQAATKRALSIAIKPTSSYAGASVAVSGKISRSPKGTVVKIQRKSGKKWVAVGSTKTTTAAGNYSRPVTLPKVAGTYSFRAVAPKTKKLRAATSRTVKVLALRKVTATLNLSAPVIQLHQKVKLSGKVSPALAGKVLFIQRLDGLKWIDFITATISKTGIYEREFTPDADTTYRVRVPRNGLYAGAYSVSRKVTISNGPISPVITTTSLPTGGVGSAYSSPLAVTTSLPAKPGAWALASGTLPAGLTLSAAGVISGTPTGAGTSSFTVIYTEKTSPTASLSDTQALSLTVYAQPTITTGSLVNAVKGVAFSQQLTRSGGSPNPGNNWTVPLGTLPAGFSLSPSGLLSGMSNTVSSSPITVKFTDIAPGVNDPAKAFTFNVFDHPVVSTSSLPVGITGAGYSQQLAKTNGSGSGTWTIESGALPAGLTLSSGGLIAGTPTAVDFAPAPFTVRFVDSGSGLDPATKQLSIKVYAQPTITTAASLPGVAHDVAYSQQLAKAGGSGSGTWGFVSGALPAGLTLSSAGLITGTPTAFGLSNFKVSFTDGVGGLPVAAKDLSIMVYGDPAIAASTLPYGVKGSAYSQQLLVGGGSGAGTWTLATGTLPAGLTLSAAGVIFGTPTADADSTFTVKFTDSVAGLAPDTEDFAIKVYTQPTVTTASLPSGVPGSPYSQQLVAAGGSGAGTWSLTTGALPAGLTLSGAGLISGTPTVTGTFPITVKFTDDVIGLNAPTKNLTLNVYTPPTITTTSLADGTKGQNYSQQLVKAGGSGSGTWSLQSGQLPTSSTAGQTRLTLSASGLISGKPLDVGDWTFTVKFTDSVTGQTVSRVLSIHVAMSGAPVITPSTLPNGTVGVAYNQQLSGSPDNILGGWSLVAGGSLPTGLSMNGFGKITGTPTVAGDFTFTVRYAVLLTNNTKQYTIHVNPAG